MLGQLIQLERVRFVERRQRQIDGAAGRRPGRHDGAHDELGDLRGCGRMEQRQRRSRHRRNDRPRDRRADRRDDPIEFFVMEWLTGVSKEAYQKNAPREPY